MRDKKRKKLQRQVNKKVRELNLNIKNDPLWKGRYFAHQINTAFWNFEDGSGVEMSFVLKYTDRKTGKTKEHNFHTFSGGIKWLDWKLFETMNDFILNSGVWEENPRPSYDNTLDYRKEHF
ncbi:MAG: hypothetical protein LIR50_16035 [Bacillota bacterium]|nr:hypothetical protein [Bacillota bacterium]